jgi:hypothetical protein
LGPQDVNGAVARKFLDRSVGVGTVARKFLDPSVGVGAVARKFLNPSVGVGTVARKFLNPSDGVGTVARKFLNPSVRAQVLVKKHLKSHIDQSPPRRFPMTSALVEQFQSKVTEPSKTPRKHFEFQAPPTENSEVPL